MDVDTMAPVRIVRILNELLGVLCRSLPAYLADADPWSVGENRFRTALNHLAADQQRYAGLLSQAIVDHAGRPDPGRFPMSFTAKNDLSLAFLRREVIEHHERDIQAIERCVAQLDGVLPLRSLAEEILGNAKGHLEILQELAIVD